MSKPLSSPQMSRIRTLEALREEYARAEALFSSIGMGAISTDESGRIDRINDTALEILGYTREELIRQWFPKVIIALDEDGAPIEPLERSITKALLSGKPVSRKSYYKTKSNNKLPVELTASPILLNDKPIGTIEVFRDISLEYEIDRMKSEFISIASHQLRTPLSAINTYSHMLQGGYYGELTEKQHESMTVILSSIERMNELITTLLDVSQIEAGKLSVKAQHVDLHKLVHGIIQELEQQVKNKKLNLTTDIAKKGLTLECDPLLLREVYTNLISNAIKYTPDRGSVSVNLKPKGKDIVFSVHDTGYGIPKEVQGHIFTKFYRADNIHNVDTTGSGLGLYLVKQIADILNGRLWFESIENKGSQFYFALPKQ